MWALLLTTTPAAVAVGVRRSLALCHRVASAAVDQPQGWVQMRQLEAARWLLQTQAVVEKRGTRGSCCMASSQLTAASHCTMPPLQRLLVVAPTVRQVVLT